MKKLQTIDVFDKINNDTIVYSFKQVSVRGNGEVFLSDIL